MLQKEMESKNKLGFFLTSKPICYFFVPIHFKWIVQGFKLDFSALTNHLHYK